MINILSESIRKETVYFKRVIMLESSLGRLYSHTKKGFFIISAFRGNKSGSENLKKHESLKKDLRNIRLGFIELYGKWIENKGMPEEKLHEEISLFVPYNPKLDLSGNQFYTIATDFMYKYKQDAIVYKDNEDLDSLIMILDKDQNAIYELGGFIPDKISEVYSTLRYGKHVGRNFIFEGYLKPSNSIHALWMKKDGMIF